jgi:DNA invertase Pin-like site-specific DNA recombinase
MKAAGYYRVSSKEQVNEGESLETQQRQIEEFVKSKEEGWELVKPLYYDPGISGGSIKKRPGIQSLLRDAAEGKFDVLVMSRLSRFARNAYEAQKMYNEYLKPNDIDLVFIKEKYDLTTPQGRREFNNAAGQAQYEREIIGEQSVENRIARGKRGIPTAGKLPVGRGFNPKTGEWRVGETFNKKTEKWESNKIAEGYRYIALEYIKGQSINDKNFLKKIKQKFGITHHPVGILKNLDALGDKWSIKFGENKKKGIPPHTVIPYNIPSICSKEEIAAIKERKKFNTTNNRSDIQKYPLTGYFRCIKCGYALSGITVSNGGKKYRYYTHHRWAKCNDGPNINADVAENIVFKMMFTDVYDEVAFNKSIKDALPDDSLRSELETKIKKAKKALKNIESDLNELVDAVLKKTLRQETIAARETELIDDKNRIESELRDNENRLKFLPDPETVKKEAEEIREYYQIFFSSMKHLNNMTYKDKQKFLNHFFNGKDEDQNPYGLYLDRDENGHKKIIFHGKFHSGVYVPELLKELGIMEIADGILKVKSDFDIEKIKKFYKKSYVTHSTGSHDLLSKPIAHSMI